MKHMIIIMETLVEMKDQFCQLLRQIKYIYRAPSIQGLSFCEWLGEEVYDE